MENATGTPAGVAARIAAATAARRRPDYTSEVRGLLDAALQVMTRNGTTGRARIADIVAAAGVSNDTFYRHFPSKDALVAALCEDGAERVAAAMSRQMTNESSAEGKIQRWLEGMLSQVKGSSAATTLAVLWNSSNLNTAIPTGHGAGMTPVAQLLHEPFRMLGSPKPGLDADLVTHAIFGRVAGHLWARTQPTRDEVDHLLGFCLWTPISGRPVRDITSSPATTIADGGSSLL